MREASRRALYAAGETFGECATRREAGRVIYGGGGSSSSQATTQQDKRIAVGDGGVGVSAESSSVNVTVTDGGIVSRGLATVDRTTDRAFDSIDASNAQLGDGYSRLLDSADKLWQRGESLIGQTQQAVADAYTLAQTDAKGTIDNRTIIVLAVAGAATIYAMSRKG